MRGIRLVAACLLGLWVGSVNAGAARAVSGGMNGWLSLVLPEGSWDEGVGVGLSYQLPSRWGPFAPALWAQWWSSEAEAAHGDRHVSVWSFGVLGRYALRVDGRFQPYLGLGPSLELARTQSTGLVKYPKSDIAVIRDITHRDIDLGLQFLAGFEAPLSRNARGMVESALALGAIDALQLRVGLVYALR